MFNFRDSEIVSTLSFIDLAGSESIRKTGNQGSQLHEGININKGLLSIGNVMRALSTNKSYIPYRESVITTILRGKFTFIVYHYSFINLRCSILCNF